jgi:hypothetical protein
MGQKTVGPQTHADSNTGEGRLGRDGELIIGSLHGGHYEQAKRGNVFMGATAVTGVAPGTAAGTTAAFALYNPSNSGIDLVILRATLSYVSGTLGVGSVNWYMHTAAVQAGAAITGTAIAAVQANGGNAGAKGKPLTTATVVAGVLARPFCNLAPSLATSVLAPWRVEDDVDGLIIVPPGAGASLQATAGAGTTPLVIFGIVWEEVAA